MQKLEMTYKELHEHVKSNPGKPIAVRAANGELTNINATCKKTSDTFKVTFKDSDYELICGDEHGFKIPNTNDSVYAKDLKPGDLIETADGTIEIATCDFHEKDAAVYDIGIDSPHWYVAHSDNNIIHHNTSFALVMAKAYLDKHEDAIILFYDSEFGSPREYFEAYDIDTARVLHTPIKHVEELKFDLINQLEQITQEDKVIIVIDSIGNLASKKELEDAINEKSVADMSRAKALKGLFRMATPYLTMNDIPMVAINHTYQEIG